MEKHLFDFNKKTIAAILVGVALFTWMFTYMKIPSGIPNTYIQTACGLGAFFASIYGPLAGGVISFAGHAISDTISNGNPCWSWVIASGTAGFLTGLVYPKLKLKRREFEKHDLVKFNLFQIVGNAVAWLVVAPVLDIIVYEESAEVAFKQGMVASMTNILSTAVIGVVLLVIYVEIKSRIKRCD